MLFFYHDHSYQWLLSSQYTWISVINLLKSVIPGHVKEDVWAFNVNSSYLLKFTSKASSYLLAFLVALSWSESPSFLAQGAENSLPKSPPVLPSCSVQPFSTYQPKPSSKSPSCLTSSSGLLLHSQENPALAGAWEVPHDLASVHLTSSPPSSWNTQHRFTAPGVCPSHSHSRLALPFHELSLAHCWAGSSWPCRPVTFLEWPSDHCWGSDPNTPCSRHTYQITLSFLQSTYPLENNFFIVFVFPLECRHQESKKMALKFTLGSPVPKRG